MKRIVVGTRKSPLALTQTNWVLDQLKKHHPDLEIGMEQIVTKGDRILDVTLSKVGGKGLFTKELEQAMYDGTVDFAVHSLKDMPNEMPEGLMIVAITHREDPRDVLISRGGVLFADLPLGAKVGTSSLRRAAQLRAARPDLEIVSLRGNINTRLAKLEEQELDAIVLAAAGLERMGWSDKITERLSPELCIPAVGQGALAIECRSKDADVRELLSVLEDPATRRIITAERTVLGKLNGGCQIPIGAFAELEGDELRLTGIVGSADGAILLRETATGHDPVELGNLIATRLIEQGAGAILAQVREELSH
ncbi:hydroxymethylbilane synthase [Tumebacillus permanentifrigoris]|uniref:Porphobilinogen deaminase n=1 Tax=Tumebacillus permanentifrigoris TaxID=378543 RepID=A0A316DCV5_9BACL|nr:hydroxymethylbilane synthase [Tumebacillus permanentifrigoris]PWK15824.1 hydroxymethylbilane synthase [Tumebacillus permanentifrigoris]